MTTHALSHLDAFFVAYQERADISMVLGYEIAVARDVTLDEVRAAVAAVVERFPRIGQRLRAGWRLRWAGAPDVAAMVHESADANGHAIQRWRNQRLDPFVEPPFQVLIRRSTAGCTLAFRVHHAATDGQGLIALCADVLAMICGVELPPFSSPVGNPLSVEQILSRAKVGELVRHARWLVGQSEPGRSARLAIASDEPGAIAVTDLDIEGDDSDRIAGTAKRAAVSMAELTGAAWIKSLGRWNRERGLRDGRPISLELPVSARRRDTPIGNFISPLVLLGDPEQPVVDIARALRSQIRSAVRQRAHLAMPFLTAPGKHLPWALFRRLAANNAFSGFATSHYTWIGSSADALAKVDPEARVLGRRTIYTPVCRHMGAALLALPWPDGLQLTVTHRLAALTRSDASTLLAHTARGLLS